MRVGEAPRQLPVLRDLSRTQGRAPQNICCRWCDRSLLVAHIHFLPVTLKYASGLSLLCDRRAKGEGRGLPPP